MNAKNFLLISAFVYNGSIIAADGKSTTHSDLKTVTVYRSGAELLHTASATLKQGNNELIIEGISNQLDVNSIQINCPSSVTLMSVEFTNNYLRAVEPGQNVQRLHDSVQLVQKDLDNVNVSLVTTTELIEVLKSNRDLKGAQQGLSVTELVRLMDYYKSKSLELQHDLSILKERQKVFSAQIIRLKKQIAEEEKKNNKVSGRIYLQLSAAIAGKADFTVSYITANAFWTPYYDIRVDDVRKPLKVLYKANLVQTTGIDWKQVKLTLSTSMPGQWGNAPTLRSWFLNYINPVTAMERGLARNKIQPFDEATNASLSEVVVTGYKAGASPATEKGGKPLYVVNGALMNEAEFRKINPAAIAKTEVLSEAAAMATYGSQGGNGVVLVTLKDGLGDYVSVSDNELNVSFDIDLPYDVPTNGKEQTATLKEYAIDALYKYYAVPKLDKDAYLLAEVAEWEKLNLLPGEANIIFEGTYVGKSFIDPNSTADTLNLTLGRDKRVVVKREKMADYSSAKFFGNSKIQKMAYETTIKNNKKDTVRLMLKDQFPLSTNKDIEVELLDEGGASLNKDIGVLTWKLSLKPGEVRKVRFSYSVKYPREKILSLN